MPTNEELTEKIKELEILLVNSEKEVTKYKFKYNSKNADYILLYNELQEYKKPMNK